MGATCRLPGLTDGQVATRRLRPAWVEAVKTAPCERRIACFYSFVCTMQRAGKGATLRSILLDHQSLQLRKSPARSLLAILEPRLPLPRGMRGSPVAAGGLNIALFSWELEPAPRIL
ncbi:hypothetical protein MPL3356_390250 [Mesorhizobium plurifarium]|uniref:Uncharacterized protein n=1 Tax=Mesorhizobium plurifarium TaxID=69974 RepID=A0A090GGS8_MESPL|nr:hypothetical protein MPL3356_390250 [Mesorhizobium plurifarium]CDX61774.1 hypothetical protein MPL3365_70099 [Mesorhizobium plurifarium]